MPFISGIRLSDRHLLKKPRWTLTEIVMPNPKLDQFAKTTGKRYKEVSKRLHGKTRFCRERNLLKLLLRYCLPPQKCLSPHWQLFQSLSRFLFEFESHMCSLPGCNCSGPHLPQTGRKTQIF